MSDAPVGPPRSPAGVDSILRNSGDLGVRVERQHASDQVFREIASAILNRELEPETPLPPERELSERFGVSRIVVREAIHRLKEYELVRVRQGSPTVVLDPDRATDIRLLGLEIELVPPTPAGMNAFAERQIYSVAGLIDLAEQRMTVEEFDAVDRLVDDFLQLPTRDTEWLAFERAFWTALSKGTRNRVYLRETLWHFNLLERDERFHETFYGSPSDRAMLYKALVARMRQRNGAAGTYLKGLRQQMFARTNGAT